MIVTIVNCGQPGTGESLAENLAVLRARCGHKAVLVDAGPGQACQAWGIERAHSCLPAPAIRTLRGHAASTGLEALLARFRDVVIVTDHCTDHECRWALIAAQVAIVALAPECADIDTHYELIARLNHARMFKPGLRVLFVAVQTENRAAPLDTCAMRAYVSQVMAAGLARTVLHLPALLHGADGPGRCACDIENSTGAAEMAALYREVYETAPEAPPLRLGLKFSLNH